MASDNYRIVSNGNESLAAFGADVPLNASNIVGKDEFGRSLIVDDVGYGSTFRLINSTLIQPLTKDQSTSLTIEYTLPKIPSKQISTFSLNFDVFPYFDYYITEGSVSIIPPEGATFLTYNQSAELNKNGFQETLTFNRDGICHIEIDLPAKATQNTYSYNPLWLSYRPILWVWLFTAVGCGVIAFWKRSKTTVSSETVATEELSSIGSAYATAFVEAYREKMRIASEITLLEVKARKGKISRRRYKMQKRKLKTRSAALSNDIIKLKAILFDTGGNNRALIRQLASAETILKQAGKEINDATSRHTNGIISLEEYKKVLSEYQQRKENAESTINGILLRLREESR